MFWAEGSGLGFRVAARKIGVFSGQYAGRLEEPTFSTESTHSGRSSSQSDVSTRPEGYSTYWKLSAPDLGNLIAHLTATLIRYGVAYNLLTSGIRYFKVEQQLIGCAIKMVGKEIQQYTHAGNPVTIAV